MLEKKYLEEKTITDNLNVAITKKEERIKELECKIPELLGLKTQKKKLSDELSILRCDKDGQIQQIANLNSTINELKASLDDRDKELRNKS